MPTLTRERGRVMLDHEVIALPLSPGVNVKGQLGIGSGGYAPDKVATGPSLPVIATVGAALNDRIDAGSGSLGDAIRRGHRFHLLKQTAMDVKVDGRTPANIQMLTMQIDLLSSDRIDIPAQGSTAANARMGNPGSGEALVGIGLQCRNGQNSNKGKFRANDPAVGLPYRFSVPSR